MKLDSCLQTDGSHSCIISQISPAENEHLFILSLILGIFFNKKWKFFITLKEYLLFHQICLKSAYVFKTY